MQAESSQRSTQVDLNTGVDIDLPPSPPPFHTSLPLESTDSATSSARTSQETTPETTPDGSLIVETPTATSTETITSNPTTTTNPSIPKPPVPPIPSTSTLRVPMPATPRRYKSTGILMTAADHPRTRSSSLPGTSTSETELTLNCMNVKFAPLPELAPRRRKSNVPLGVAARGQLMRKKRAMMYGYSDENGSPMWTEEETEIHLRRQVEAQEKRRISLMQAIQDEEERLRGDEEVEDPFVALGRMMKGAWRKMSGKDKAKGTAAAATPDSNVPPVPEESDSRSKAKTEGDEKKSSDTAGEHAESGTGDGSAEKEKKQGWEIETIVDQ